MWETGQLINWTDKHGHAGVILNDAQLGLSLGGGLWTSGDNRAQDYLFVPHYSAGTIMGSGQQNEPYKAASQGLSWS